MRLFEGDGAKRRLVTKAQTKVCPLCGALNFHTNTACLACSWHGGFERDAPAIDYQWQRLAERFEEVRLEHVTPGRTREIGHFGVARKASPWRRLHEAIAAAVQRFRDARPARPEPSGRSSAPPPKV